MFILQNATPSGEAQGVLRLQFLKNHLSCRTRLNRPIGHRTVIRSDPSVTGFWCFEWVESGDGCLVCWGDRYRMQHNNFLLRLI